MITFEAIAFEEAARRTGLSVEYISSLKSDGNILVLTGSGDNNLPSTDCAMIGIREAAKRAGLSESTIRNYADRKEIYCVTNPINRYRSVWVNDVTKLNTRISG
jgi:hypothetical protein